ncbi:MAG: START-like domain-containing protein [Chitinophagaceae bacterium]
MAKTKKQKYTLEIKIKSSPLLLYKYISNAADLNAWFADKVEEVNGKFIFEWNSSTEKEYATLLECEENVFAKYRWIHQSEDEYFEFRIVSTELSNQTILVIEDFALPNEINDQKLLWEAEVKKLLHLLGN